VVEADLELMILELGSLESVREFAYKLHSRVDKVPIVAISYGQYHSGKPCIAFTVRYHKV
jgi:hypothetical protein